MHTLRLYLFVGYPGAGKTTVARMLADATGAVHLWADFERHVMFGTPTHSKKESRILYDHLNQLADDLLGQGKSVVYDTNFNFRADRDYMRQIARKHGAETIVVWVQTPRQVAKQRATQDSEGQETRIWGNMPPADFDRMSDNLQQPDGDEAVIQIDGTNITKDALQQKLGL